MVRYLWGKSTARHVGFCEILPYLAVFKRIYLVSSMQGSPIFLTLGESGLQPTTTSISSKGRLAAANSVCRVMMPA
ncbi:MAG: hypothetical protein WA161_17820, partial [Pseudomonas sp.]|uniref:hypothetical protein n=1 Tax=Pseudomonas sp. TaxID=306 RepID=UPI003BB76934